MKTNAKTLTPDLLHQMDAYWRAANYLSVGQIYLYDNPLLRRPLTLADVKHMLLGHWGTTPGQKFIYVHLNRVINKYDLNMIYVSGPGHGGPAVVGNTYLEGSCLANGMTRNLLLRPVRIAVHPIPQTRCQPDANSEQNRNAKNERTIKLSKAKTKRTQTPGPPTGSPKALARPLQSPPTETPRQPIEKNTMKIQVNTDNHITGREALVEQAEATITSALGRLAEHITRVEVHLSDENGNKTGDRDKRCMMEARLESHQPIAVTDESDSLDEAIAGAADKLKRLLDHTLNRLNPQ